MKKGCFAWMFLCVLLICPAFYLFAQQRMMVLITEKEAAMADAPESAPAILEVEKMKGPVILIHTPKNGESYQRPVKVEMEFVPRKEAAVDLRTLKVVYVKWINIDITDRIIPFATEKGINILEADIPEGKHKIKITIADIGGNKSSEELLFVVR